MRIIALLFLLLASSVPAWPQGQNFPGGGGTTIVTSNPAMCTSGQQFYNTNTGQYLICTSANTLTASPSTTVTGLFPPGKIAAEYQFKPTETCAAAVDYSGNGNTVTGASGTAPLIIPVTGGCNMLGNGSLNAPASLNTAQAITAYFSYQSGGNGAQSHNVLVGGNGNGTTNHCNSIDFYNVSTGGGPDPRVNGSNIYATANGGTIIDTSIATWNGTGIITWSWGTTQGGGADDDKLWINGIRPNSFNTLSALRANQTIGNYQIGGSAAGSCISTASFITSKIYWVVFWAIEPSNAEEALARNFIVNAMANRNVNVSMTNNIAVDQNILVGDSITAGNGLTQTAWNWAANNCGPCFLRPFPNISNTGISGLSFTLNIFPVYQVLLYPYLGSGTSPGNAINNMTMWAGTNDAPGSTASAQSIMDGQGQVCRDWKTHGGNRCMVATMLSRTGEDTSKDFLDPVIISQWQLYFDNIMDYAANPLLGADGAFGNTSGAQGVFQVDSVHPNQNGEYNIILPYFLHGWNSIIAPNNFSAANTYTTTTPTAVAVTAATESGNTMTFTTAANTFTIGQCVTVTGVTPSGYNTPANMCWTILTAPNNTTFTAWNNVTALGALTVAGTAAVPQETDNDAYYATLGQCTTCTHTLEPCEWHIGQIKRLRITSTSAWTITPRQSTETINGAATFTSPTASASNNPIVRLDAIRGTAAVAGCTWRASLE